MVVVVVAVLPVYLVRNVERPLLAVWRGAVLVKCRGGC